VHRLLRRIPLRVKLVAAVLALVSLALVVISVASVLALRSYLIGRIDDQLQVVTQEAIALRRPPVAGDMPTDYLFALQGPENTETRFYATYTQDDLPPLPGNLTESAKLAGHAYTATAKDGEPRWRVLVTSVSPTQTVIVGQSLSEVDHAVGRLIWIELIVGVSVLIVLAAVGVEVVRRSLRPLGQIEETAAAIGAGDLTKRVPGFEDADDEPKTEVGRLAQSLNAMLAQIEAAFTARAASETAALAAESAARDAAVAAQVSEARARRSEERMRQFVADASHELRTPLTTIRGFAELYRQGAARSPEETATLLRRIEDEAARMGLLVEDLLLLARLDRERPLELAPVELPVIAADAVQAAGAVAPDRAVTLDIANDAGPLVVLADDGRLRQIVGNLMTNALTHTPEGTPVTVRLYRAGTDAVLEVADSGPGLTGEQAERVFERFYRVDAARTRRPVGVPSTGLGLAIVAALVAAHQGTVEVDSEPGRGTTFRVRLPLADETPNGETPNGETPNGETPNGETPNGETPNGETPNGETVYGEAVDGETPDADTADVSGAA
jgi:two-component system OmpR family sensor kinase